MCVHVSVINLQSLQWNDFELNVIILILLLVLFFAVSQPKLKRVSSDINPKTNQEDIQKSQTYQQFVRNMENEIRRLQETEHFYNNGE